MKLGKVIFAVSMFVMSALPVLAQIEPQPWYSGNMRPIYVPRSTTAMTVYNKGNTGVMQTAFKFYLKGGTTTYWASYQITATSVTCKTLGGMYPGSGNYIYAATDSVKDVQIGLMSRSKIALGFEGGFIVTSTDILHPENIPAARISTSTVFVTGIQFSTSPVSVYVIPTAYTPSFGVFSSTGVSLKTLGGLYPGTTMFTISAGGSTDADTLEHLINTINALPAGLPGVSNGWTATRGSAAYLPGPTYALTSVASTACNGLANAITITFRTTTGISYIFGKGSMDANRKYHVTDCNANITYGTGGVYCDVYDGYSSTNTVIRHETLPSSGQDYKLDIPPAGTLCGKVGTDLRFDVYGDSIITGGYMNFTGYTETQ